MAAPEPEKVGEVGALDDLDAIGSDAAPSTSEQAKSEESTTLPSADQIDEVDTDKAPEIAAKSNEEMVSSEKEATSSEEPQMATEVETNEEESEETAAIVTVADEVVVSENTASVETNGNSMSKSPEDGTVYQEKTSSDEPSEKATKETTVTDAALESQEVATTEKEESTASVEQKHKTASGETTSSGESEKTQVSDEVLPGEVTSATVHEEPTSEAEAIVETEGNETVVQEAETISGNESVPTDDTPVEEDSADVATKTISLDETTAEFGEDGVVQPDSRRVTPEAIDQVPEQKNIPSEENQRSSTKENCDGEANVATSDDTPVPEAATSQVEDDEPSEMISQVESENATQVEAIAAQATLVDAQISEQPQGTDSDEVSPHSESGLVTELIPPEDGAVVSTEQETPCGDAPAGATPTPPEELDEDEAARRIQGLKKIRDAKLEANRRRNDRATVKVDDVVKASSEQNAAEVQPTSGTEPATELPNELPENVSQLQRLFDLFEKDTAGQIHCDEIIVSLRAVGFNPSQGEVSRFIKESGIEERLNFAQFTKVLREFVPDKRPGIAEALQAFDNPDHMVDLAEFRRIMTTQGEPLSEEEYAHLVEQVIATSGDQDKVQFSDFVKVLTTSSLRQTAPVF